MSKNLKKCEAQALSLSPKDRAVLAEHLIESLDAVDDAENERRWVEEAERRYQEYKKGKIPARPAEDVFRDASAKFK